MAQTKTIQELRQAYSREQIFAGTDAATQLGLEKHFWYRHACDSDEKFLFFLHRNIEEKQRQYSLLLDAEATQVDPLIINLEERTKQLTGNTSKTFTLSETLTKLATVTDDKEKQENSTITGETESSGSSTASNSYESEDHNTRTDNLANSQNVTSRSRNLHSDTPQANVASTTVGDLDDPITWTYASDLQDTSESDTTSGTNTGTQTLAGTSEGSGSNTSSNTSNTESSQTGAKTTTEDNTKTTNGTDTKTGNNTETNETEGEETTTLSGRNNHLVSEILDEWNKYVRKTNAFLWLCQELERCFMPNLLYDEDEEDENEATRTINERKKLWNYKTS